jgi:alkanesulfonate monooxygenase SsuD/methylene tetrahydromethanopterin reductase-like flavin-dependent oxidoreductase (luciferase family)
MLPEPIWALRKSQRTSSIVPAHAQIAWAAGTTEHNAVIGTPQRVAQRAVELTDLLRSAH